MVVNRRVLEPDSKRPISTLLPGGVVACTVLESAAGRPPVGCLHLCVCCVCCSSVRALWARVRARFRCAGGLRNSRIVASALLVVRRAGGNPQGERC